MLDIGFMEIFVIGALALIIVGPKDLPGLLRTVGQFAAKARGMAREFQSSMEEAARDADLGDMADVVKGKGNLNKLPFDNQIVDSMKEFERTVKGTVDDAKSEFDKPAAATPKVDPASPSVSGPEVSPAAKPDPATPAKATAAKKKPAAKATAAKKPAAKKAPAAKNTAAKPKAVAKPKAPAKPKTTPEKSA